LDDKVLDVARGRGGELGNCCIEWLESIDHSSA